MIVTADRSLAGRAAASAGVTIEDLQDATELVDVERLLATVWGTAESASPIPLDLLCGFAHAGGQVAAARDGATRELAGAAVAIGAPGRPEAYSLIAAVRPASGRAGVGFALKQHQRAWSLERGCRTMRWTFDPLVRRNAWFNLGRLGALVVDYRPAFFGRMHDALNRGDLSDRLVVQWRLDEPAGAGGVRPAADPRGDVLATAPDGEAAVVEADGVRWVRTPPDVVALREVDLPAALAWRHLVRDHLAPPVAAGAAVGFTRDGWYRIEARP